MKLSVILLLFLMNSLSVDSRFIDLSPRERNSIHSSSWKVSHALQRKAQSYEDIVHTIRMPSGGGMTYDFCRTSVDCKGGRNCLTRDLRDNLCSGEAECICTPRYGNFGDCSRQSDCEPGEVCPEAYISHFCVSESYADDLDEPPNRDGFTLDKCSTTDDCEPPRLCQLEVDGSVQDCNGRSKCMCFPFQQFQKCTAHRDCVYGEVCAIDGETGESLCLSETVVSNSTHLVPVPRMLTGDPCITGKDCQKPRECKVINLENKLKYCAARSGCFCTPKNPVACRRSDDCVNGEVCAQDAIGRMSDEPVCVSQTYAKKHDLITVGKGSHSQPTSPLPLQSPLEQSQEQSLETEVCVDAHALQGFGKEDLLYATHRAARVLCDENGSCATRGHIVRFKGRAMMMRSYCRMACCKEKVMMVNSVKYRRNILVPAMTTGLYFTAFAARHETKAEELMLSALVRFGM